MPPKAAKVETKPADTELDDCSILNRVTELLQQQKDMFKELLHQQQENFKGFVKIIMETTNSRLDNITKDIQDLKTSLQFTQQEVDKLKDESAKLSERGNTQQTDVYKVCDSLLAITDKMEYLESQSRRNNLVIDGVEETPGESWADVEEKVKKILQEKLQLQRTVEVERAHRLGKPGGGGSDRPRPIVAKLLRWKDRETILQRAKLLKGSKIFINEDYTDSVKRKRKELMPELRAARERGDIAYLRHDRLVIHPRSSTPKPRN